MNYCSAETPKSNPLVLRKMCAKQYYRHMVSERDLTGWYRFVNPGSRSHLRMIEREGPFRRKFNSKRPLIISLIRFSSRKRNSLSTSDASHPLVFFREAVFSWFVYTLLIFKILPSACFLSTSSFLMELCTGKPSEVSKMYDCLTTHRFKH